MECCSVSSVSYFVLVVPKQWRRLAVAEPQSTEILVSWPVMNKLCDEIQENVLLGYRAAMTSTSAQKTTEKHEL